MKRETERGRKVTSRCFRLFVCRLPCVYCLVVCELKGLKHWLRGQVLSWWLLTAHWHEHQLCDEFARDPISGMENVCAARGMQMAIGSMHLLIGLIIKWVEYAHHLVGFNEPQLGCHVATCNQTKMAADLIKAAESAVLEFTGPKRRSLLNLFMVIIHLASLDY